MTTESLSTWNLIRSLGQVKSTRNVISSRSQLTIEYIDFIIEIVISGLKSSFISYNRMDTRMTLQSL